MWNSGRLDYSELANVLSRDAKGEYFAEGTKERQTFSNLLDKEMENSKDHGCPKVQDLVDKEVWIYSSYPFRHKTVPDNAKATW